MSPTILTQNKKIKAIEITRKERLRKAIEDYQTAPINKLNVDVFKDPQQILNPPRYMRSDHKITSLTKSPKNKYYWVKSRYLRKSQYFNNNKPSFNSIHKITSKLN